MADLNSLSSSATSKLDLPDDVKAGVVVGSVQKGMPADGKLQENDVITEIDGKEISSKTDIQTNLYSHSIGDTIKVTFYRGKEKKTEELKLTNLQKTCLTKSLTNLSKDLYNNVKVFFGKE